MPKRRTTYKALIPTSHRSTVVVVDTTLTALLGLPAIQPALLRNEALVPYLRLTEQLNKQLPPWLATLKEWVINYQPTLICLSPDLVLDRVLYGSFLAPQSYGFGVPDHVPALYKPNGSLNWFSYTPRKIPKPEYAWFPLLKRGLGCHRDLDLASLRQLPDTAFALDLDGQSEGDTFKEVRDACRKRLEQAHDVLLLGLNADAFRKSDVDLLKDLTPRQRLTLVCPTPTQAGRVARSLSAATFTELELASADDWIVNRLLQWSSV